jgi:hypothetical protein
MTLAFVAPISDTSLSIHAETLFTVQDTSLPDRTTITWSSASPYVEFSSDQRNWAATLDTTIDTRKETSCYLRYTDMTPIGTVPITVTQQGVPANTAMAQYNFVLISVIDPPNNTILPASSNITLEAEADLPAGAMVTWESDDPTNVEFSAGDDDWAPLINTQVRSDGGTTCYVRWMNQNAQSPTAGTRIRVSEQGNPANHFINTYFFKVINVSGVGNHAAYTHHGGTPMNNSDANRIEITTLVSDLEGNPIPGWVVIYHFLSDDRPLMWGGPGQQNPISESGAGTGFRFVTQASGVVRAFIGSQKPTIVTVQVEVPGYGTKESTMVFATPMADNGSWVTSPEIVEDANPLDISDNGVAFNVVLSDSIGSNPPAHANPIFDNNLAALVLNGVVVKVGTIKSLKHYTLISTIPLNVDGTTINQLWVMIRTPGDFIQSIPNNFVAIGDKVIHPDYKVRRVMDPPSIKSAEVNWDAIMNDLRVTFPGYDNFPIPGLGGPFDIVIINVYLNAYIAGTNTPKSGTIQIIYNPRPDEWQTGFSILIPRYELLGYSGGLEKRGQIEIEYIVDNATYVSYPKRWSDILGYPRWVTLDT